MAASLRRLVVPASACVLCQSTAYAEAPPSPSPPRVGLVGTGWALKVQRPRFREEGLPVTALYSRDLGRAEALCRAEGIGGAYDSVPALARSGDVDLVSVVCPTHLRKGHVLETVAAGKDVLCDKPMALDAAEAREMWRAAEARGVRHFMDFELRCCPTIIDARDALRRGDVGAVRFLEFRCHGNFPFLDPANPSFGHWNDRACGGGAFSAVGTHFTDLVRFQGGKF